MDYRSMAEDLLNTLSIAPQAKAERQMLKRIKGHIFVITYLSANNNKAYPKDLSDAMMVSTARVAVILRQLEENGMITRATDPEDNRQVIVSLTEKGQTTAEKYHSEALESVVKMLEYLGPEDALSYIRIRKKLLKMNMKQKGVSGYEE